jgi:hypothetical protein
MRATRALLGRLQQFLPLVRTCASRLPLTCARSLAGDPHLWREAAAFCGERETRPSSEAMGLGRRDVRAGGPSGKGGRRAYSVRLGCHAQPEGVPRAVPQLVGRPTAQGHQRTQVRRCSGGVGRHLISPTALATLPDARTPQSHCPPLPHGNACAGPQRESLRVVKVAVESGYTQQKIQPWRRRDVRRSRVKGRGQGTPRCAHLTDSGLRAIRQAQPPRHAPTVAPARAGLTLSPP